MLGRTMTTTAACICKNKREIESFEFIYPEMSSVFTSTGIAIVFRPIPASVPSIIATIAIPLFVAIIAISIIVIVGLISRGTLSITK